MSFASVWTSTSKSRPVSLVPKRSLNAVAKRFNVAVGRDQPFHRLFHLTADQKPPLLRYQRNMQLLKRAGSNLSSGMSMPYFRFAHFWMYSAEYG